MNMGSRGLMLLLAVAGFSTARAGGVSPFADVLIWQASQETSSVWSSIITQGTTPTGAPESAFSAAEVKFDWDPGVRTGFSFQPDERPWDMKLYWTYFPTSQAVTVPPGDQLVIPEFFSGFLSGDAFTFTAASIDWKLDFNTFDYEIGHEITVTESLSIRPSVGVTAAVINQSISARWAAPTSGITASEKVDHDFWGVGPSFGIGGRWIVPKLPSLRLVSTVSGAFMSGVWNVKDTYERASPVFSPFSYQTVTTEMKDSVLGTFMIRYFLGLEWTHPGVISTTIHAGYELQWWANQQRLPTFQQLPMHGDLTLQGATCGISFCF